MRLRIANLGVAATHERLASLSTLIDDSSLSDFDALVFDPDFVGTTVGAQSQGYAECLLRKVVQVSDLMTSKAGAVVALLRANRVLADLRLPSSQIYRFDTYFLLDDLVIQGARPFPFDSITAGVGSSYVISPTASAAGRKYFRTLEGHLQFHAHFADASAEIVKRGRIIAQDSVGHVIAAQLDAANGKIMFLPVPVNVPSDRVGAAIVEAVSTLLRGEPEVEQPEWVERVVIPGSDIHDVRITELRERQKDLRDELNNLGAKKAELNQHKNLLFGTGKAVLEPAVRSALRLIGFEVPEPEEYSGEWDAQLRLADGRTALAEIEGAEGMVGVDKFRQLHHYLGEEALEGRTHKGILIGNGFRNQEPSSRTNQFSDHVITAAQKFGICLLPTTELFKVVCAILEHPEDTSLRSHVRESLLTSVGPWAFAT